MEFHEWEPFYDAILADFGYDRSSDERARDWLVERVDQFDLDEIGLSADDTVAVAGAAPSLEAQRSLAEDADAVVAASDAGTRLAAQGIRPDLVVTDLDGDPKGTLALAGEGVPVAIHAHGDNRDLLEEFVPQFPRSRIVGTTQAKPVGPLYNYGGFTDGDRAAFLADAIGGRQLVFPGWDLDAAAGLKARKLEWAGLLLHWLERRRDERFDVLDGRRERIDLSGYPEP
ncbi:DUF115 domain-containing protein [Salinarchaeum chitinilyticum]